VRASSGRPAIGAVNLSIPRIRLDEPAATITTSAVGVGTG
jgi:hypothetical protein